MNSIGCNEFTDQSSVASIKDYIDDNYKHIFVDLESLDPCDTKPFTDLAATFYYMVICPDLRDDAKLSKGPSGDTPITVDLSNLLVSFAGWFLSDTDQSELHKVGRACYNELLKIESIRDQLRNKIDTDDIDQYFPEQKKRLHVTSKYIGGQPDSDYVTQASASLYSMSKTIITGILLTPRTFSCHVKLPGKDRRLFDDDEEFLLKPHITLAVGGPNKPVESGYDEIEVQTLIKEKVNPRATYETLFGKANDYDQCRFYVTLRKSISLSTLFNFMYTGN